MSTLVVVGTLAFGVVVGVASAYLGVGGGVLMVPFIAVALEHGQHVAEGTALLVSVPTAIAGALSHRRRGFVLGRRAAPMALGGVAGSFAGARLALALDGDTLRTLFGLLLVVAGAAMALRGASASRRS